MSVLSELTVARKIVDIERFDVTYSYHSESLRAVLSTFSVFKFGLTCKNFKFSVSHFEKKVTSQENTSLINSENGPFAIPYLQLEQ